MPLVRPSYKAFSDMPPGLQNFVLADEFSALDDTLQKKYALTDDQKSTLGDLFYDAVFNDFTLADMLSKLKAALVPAAIPEAKWTSFEEDFLKTHAWPLRELFSDELTQVLSADKIETSAWPLQRVILKPLTFSGAASEVASAAGFSLMASQSRERLRDLIVSKSKGVRLETQIKESLMRSADFGGLGLDGPTADKAVAAINDLLANAKIMTEDEYSDWLASENQKKVDAMAATVTPPSEDDAEIAAIKAKMPVAPPTLLDSSVDQIFDALPGKPSDDYLAKRLKYIISSRLRDVRSQIELKQLLARDTKVGGLGLAKSDVESLSTQIEEGYKKFHQPIKDEEKAKLDQQLEEQRQKIDERRKKEAEEHAQWYKEKVLARKDEEEQRSKLAEQFKQSFASPSAPSASVHPMDLKEQKTETARFGEMIPASSPTVPSPAASSPSSPVARPEVKVSKATAILQAAAPAGRPRLDDVAAYSGPKLTGPIQELKSLTLSEFRRIAKDPQSAAQKVLQRIDTLGQESFERRIEGVKAWQTSPLQRHT
jgi:hypothetical protein